MIDVQTGQRVGDQTRSWLARIQIRLLLSTITNWLHTRFWPSQCGRSMWQPPLRRN